MEISEFQSEEPKQLKVGFYFLLKEPHPCSIPTPCIIPHLLHKMTSENKQIQTEMSEEMPEMTHEMSEHPGLTNRSLAERCQDRTSLQNDIS